MDDYQYHLYEELAGGRLSRREFLVRASVMGLSTSAVGSILAACGSTGPTSPSTRLTAPKRGGTLRFAGAGLGGPVDPVEGYSAGQTDITTPVLDPLVTLRHDYTLRPTLASSWHAKSPSEWVFTIRSGVLFQDGTPMTVDDVVASFNKFYLSSRSSGLSNYAGILKQGNVEKVDSSTVAFHLEVPFVDFPYLLSGYGILPQNYKLGSITNGRIGTGPFILTHYVTNQSATFVRNPHYWDKPRPYLDGWHVTLYSDYAPMLAALQTGSVDIVPAVPRDQARTITSNPNIKIIKQKSSSYRELFMRVDRHPFTDKRVRQALAYTIDRPGTIQALFQGDALLGNDEAFCPIFRAAPTSSQLPQRSQDIAKAKALLAQAGFGAGLNVTLTTEQYLEIPTYVTLVKAYAAKAGINISLNVESLSTFYGSGNNQPWLQVPFGCVDWAGRAIAGELIDSAYTTQGIWNSAHWRDAAFTKLIFKYNSELDVQRRRQYALQAARIQQDETPAIISYWITSLNAVAKNVQGYNAVTTDSPTDPAYVWLSS